MSDGRTVWWSKDATWYDRESNILLGAEFGAEGTTVIDVLCCQAKLENDAGRVKTGYASLTRRGNIGSEKTTRTIVARAVEIGALDDFAECGLTFTVRVSGWRADQDHARAAAKQAAYRQREAERPVTSGNGPVTLGNDPSPTEQNRTEQTTTTSSLRSDVVEPDRLDTAKNRLKANEVNELFAYWQKQCGHAHAKLTAERKQKLLSRRKEGYTVEQIMRGIDGAAQNPPRDRSSGVVHDDLVSICRTGSQLERYIGRATATVDDGGPLALAARIQARHGASG